MIVVFNFALVWVKLHHPSLLPLPYGSMHTHFTAVYGPLIIPSDLAEAPAAGDTTGDLVPFVDG